MESAFSQLRELAERFSSIRLYPPADTKMVFRTAGRLPGSLDPHLREFFGYSNGARVLDYCVVGCKNQDLMDLAENTLSLWPLNNWLAGEFVGFITTSAGENFGYLRRVEGSDGSHPVAYLRRPEDQFVFVVSTSIGRFLGGFLQDIGVTLSRNQAALNVELGAWPYDLSTWIARDPGLLGLYSSGELSEFVENHVEYDALIGGPLLRCQRDEKAGRH